VNPKQLSVQIQPRMVFVMLFFNSSYPSINAGRENVIGRFKWTLNKQSCMNFITRLNC